MPLVNLMPVQTWIATNGLKLILWLMIALAVFLGGLKVGTWRGNAKLNALKAEYAQALAAAEATARQREQALQEKVDASKQSLDAAKARIKAQDRAIAALRTDVVSLRNDLSAYAAGQGAGPSCDERSKRLGAVAAEGVGLLAEGEKLLSECASNADERSAEVKALLEAWPKP